MPEQLLHERADFADLIEIVAEEKGITNPAMVERIIGLNLRYQKHKHFINKQSRFLYLFYASLAI